MKSAHIDLIKVPVRKVNVDHVVQQIVLFYKLVSHSNPERLHGVHVLWVLRIGGILHHVVANVVAVVVANDRLVDLRRQAVLVHHLAVLDQLEVVFSGGGHNQVK